jgi:hypothetical protein
VMLGVERANNDLAMFILIWLATSVMSNAAVVSWRAGAAYALIWLATFLKSYPLGWVSSTHWSHPRHSPAWACHCRIKFDFWCLRRHSSRGLSRLGRIGPAAKRALDVRSAFINDVVGRRFARPHRHRDIGAIHWGIIVGTRTPADVYVGQPHALSRKPLLSLWRNSDRMLLHKQQLRLSIGLSNRTATGGVRAMA